MQTGSAKKKSMKAGGPMLTTEMPSAKVSNISAQPKTVKFVEPNGNLGDLIVKSTTMSKEIKDGAYRQIRYIQGAQSIYVDEQGDVSMLTIRPIEMIRGQILVSDPLLMKYLQKSDQNVANGGKVFKEENPEKDAQTILDSKSKIAEAVYKANTGLPIEKIRAVMRSMGTPNVSLLADSVVRLEAVRMAEANPDRFLSQVSSPLPDVIESVGIAIEQGIIEISLDNQSVSWVDSTTSFLKIPPGYENARLEFISKFLLTEDGAEILDTINKAIKKK